MSLLEKEIGVLSKKQYPKIVFLVCFGYIALSIQCIPGHSNRVCDCYLYEILFVQNQSVDTIIVSYSADDSGFVVLPADTLHVKPGSVADDTIELKLTSHLDETFTLSGNSQYKVKMTRIDVAVWKNDSLTHRNINPFDTAADWVEYHCDEKYYHYDTLIVQ
jgi:hypothetical protein